MLEMILSHDGKNWVAVGERFKLSSPTLERLDQELGETLRSEGMLQAGQTTKVFMAFDNSTIPQWIRQYAQHYFNRIVEVRG